MTLLQKIEKTLNNKYLRIMKENSAQSINQSLITTYDSLKQVGNCKQKKELIKLLQCKNQDLHNFYI